jgi:YHS domain-containing protein
MMKSMNIGRTTKGLLAGGVVFALGLAGGCASSGPAAAAPSPVAAVTASHTAAHAECLVCKHNADLACVDVTVDKDTPSFTYHGLAYYFCSDSCLKKFQKDPAKYANEK